MEIKEYSYKGEHYSARDNGAVLCHVRERERIRKDDNTWTFGKPNKNAGYMEIRTGWVHRIVASALLGKPPTPQHIVDHIDTNCKNNKPQNLRWLIKLESVLGNPIAGKKIGHLCESIEAFVNDSSTVQEPVDDNPNYEWVRIVAPEEAKASYERLCAWIGTKNNGKSLDGVIGGWIYTPYGREEKKPPFEREQHNIDVTLEQIDSMISIDSHTGSLTESLTPNAVQGYWCTPTEFPLCPSEIRDRPLTTYLSNLRKDAIITKNQYTTHFIGDFASYSDNHLVIIIHADDGTKESSMITIAFEDGEYVHEGTTLFEKQGA